MQQRKTLELVRGNRSGLQIEDTEEDFVSTAGTGVAAGAAMLGLSAAGLGGNPPNLAAPPISKAFDSWIYAVLGAPRAA